MTSMFVTETSTRSVTGAMARGEPGFGASAAGFAAPEPASRQEESSPEEGRGDGEREQ